MARLISGVRSMVRKSLPMLSSSASKIFRAAVFRLTTTPSLFRTIKPSLMLEVMALNSFWLRESSSICRAICLFCCAIWRSSGLNSSYTSLERGSFKSRLFKGFTRFRAARFARKTESRMARNAMTKSGCSSPRRRERTVT